MTTTTQGRVANDHPLSRRCGRSLAALFASICMLILLIPASLSAADGGKAIFFGDSITARGAWPAAVGEAMGWRAVKAGVGGRRLTGSSLEALQKDLGKNGDATHLFIMLGVNDVPARNPAPEEQRITDCVASMDQLITAALEQIPAGNIVILGPCNTNPDNMSHGNKKKGYDITPPLLQQLNTQFEQLAQRRGVRFLSLYATVSPENLPDGLHPNEAGGEEISRAIIAFMQAPIPAEPTPAEATPAEATPAEATPAEATPAE